MTIKGFSKTKTADYALSRLQDVLNDVFNSIFLCDLIDGVDLKDVTFLANQDNIISHGLERPYVGWFVIDKNNFGDIKRSDAVNNAKDKKIILTSNANMVASIRVF